MGWGVSGGEASARQVERVCDAHEHEAGGGRRRPSEERVERLILLAEQLVELVNHNEAHAPTGPAGPADRISHDERAGVGLGAAARLRRA